MMKVRLGIEPEIEFFRIYPTPIGWLIGLERIYIQGKFLHVFFSRILKTPRSKLNNSDKIYIL